MKKLLAVLMFIITVPFFAFAGDCTVDASVQRQYIRGFGASTAWSDWGGNSADNAWLVAHTNDFYTDTTGIGLTMIRARINPVSSQWGGTAAPLKAAQDLGVTDIFATAWTPPAEWKSNNATDNANGDYLLPEYYDEYAEFLRDYVIYMRDSQQVNITSISPANEPDYKVSYDGCTWSGEQLRDFLKNNLGPTFAAAGLTTKLVIGESFNNNNSYIIPSVSDAAARAYLDVGATHFYGGGPTACPELAANGKEYWQTEKSSFETYDGTMTHGLVTARWLHTGLVTASYNAFFYWWLGSDQTNEGLMSETLGIPKRYYTFANFSKFIRPGYYRIDATQAPTSNINVSAYKNPTNTQHVIVAINNGTSQVSQRFNLSGITAGVFTPYITSSSQNLVKLADVVVSGGSFTYNLPAQSVISFVSPSGPTPTPTNTWDPLIPTYTSTYTATATATPASVLLDDFEDNNTVNNLSGDWYKYSGTNSNNFALRLESPGYNSSSYAIHVTGNVSDYGGFGTNLSAVQDQAIDLTSYQGIEFYIKGSGSCFVQFPQPSITGGDNYGKQVSASSTWTKVTVLFDGLATRWGETAAFTQNAISAIQWSNAANGAYDIMVDDVRFIYAAGVVTSTHTHTNTATHTATHTNTSTYTATVPASTSTYTATIPVNTSTHTATYTHTYTYTNTNTATHTVTNSPASTNTATHTETEPVNTATYTYTHTNTYTATDTATVPTSTNTHTATVTDTVIPGSTDTNTYTATYTHTSTNTYTATPSATNTGTNTAIAPTNTYTSTATYSATNTSTNTVSLPTNTYTHTATVPTNTHTRTYTNTATRTHTYTRTNTPVPPTLTFTNTYTNTPTQTYSQTPTPTATSQPADADEQKIEDIFVFPHPYNSDGGDMRLRYKITKRASEINLKIYSSSFRLIKDIIIGADLYAGEHTAQVSRRKLNLFANGSYYFVIKDDSGAVSKVEKLIILK